MSDLPKDFRRENHQLAERGHTLSSNAPSNLRSKARARKAAAASAKVRSAKAKRNRPGDFYVDRLMHEWRLDEQSDRFQARVRRVLRELCSEALLFLIGPKLEIAVRPDDRGLSVWAYFPIHRRRSVAQELHPKSDTRVLLVFNGEFEKQSARQSEDELRDHLGHTLLYLRSPKARNDCPDAQKEWRAFVLSRHPFKIREIRVSDGRVRFGNCST
jgi:hypothetical protein